MPHQPSSTNSCTGKTRRSLAAAGSLIGVILAEGEWKSSAFLRYCQADEISVSAVLEVMCAEDEDGVASAGGGKGPRRKPKGRDGKECRWNRHAKSGIGGRPVSVTLVSRLCSVTMVALVACTPFALVAIQPVTSVGWRRPNLVVLGHLVRLSRCAR